MKISMKDLGIDQVSAEDRLALVDEIWDSLVRAPEQIPLPEAAKQMLDRRLADLDSNPDNVLTWDEIKAEFMKSR